MKHRLSLLCGSLCVMASFQSHALDISSVVVDKQILHPASQETFALRFKLDEAADTALNIYDERDYLVRRVALGKLPVGEQSAHWDLNDAKGKTVPPEIYRYTLQAKNEQGEALYDLSDITGKKTIPEINLLWNAEQKKISYVLTSPACIGIRAGLADRGPLLKNIVNWLPRQAGVHEQAWDGMDASGVLDLTNHPHLLLVADAYTLPDNTLFVLPDSAADIQQMQFAANTEMNADHQPIKRVAPVIPQKEMHAHAQQAVEERGDYPISLTLAGDKNKNKEGAWIVKGVVSIILDVDPALVNRLVSQRFEQSFYVDGRYHFENEIGFLPATLKWDSAEYSEGVHYITANLRGYEGNFGMATLKVYVKR